MHGPYRLDPELTEAYCPGSFRDWLMLPSELFQFLTMAVAGTKIISKRSARTFVEDGAESSEATEYNTKRTVKYEESGSHKEDRRPSISSSSGRASLSVVEESTTLQAEQSSGSAAYRSSDAVSSSGGNLAMALEEFKSIDLFHQTACYVTENILPERNPLHPINFGVIVPGVYRSSYPLAEDYQFIRGLQLKTIITLVQKGMPEGYRSFITGEGIRHHIFDMKGTKKEDIPLRTMRSILRLVLDRRNHPLLIHCNHGRHRTGCVVAVIRKVSGWEMTKILDEYRGFAEPKVRECDLNYITSFDLSHLSTLFVREQRTQFHIRSFFRTIFVAFIVLVIWLASGSKMATKRRLPRQL